jgi:hypothetical protein
MNPTYAFQGQVALVTGAGSGHRPGHRQSLRRRWRRGGAGRRQRSVLVPKGQEVQAKRIMVHPGKLYAGSLAASAEVTNGS